MGGVIGDMHSLEAETGRQHKEGNAKWSTDLQMILQAGGKKEVTGELDSAAKEGAEEGVSPADVAGRALDLHVRGAGLYRLQPVLCRAPDL